MGGVFDSDFSGIRVYEVQTSKNSWRWPIRIGAGLLAVAAVAFYFGSELLPDNKPVPPLAEQFERVGTVSFSMQAMLTPQAAGDIQGIVDAFQGRVNLKLAVVGFSSPDGEFAANQQISGKRAEVVAAQLASHLSNAEFLLAACGEDLKYSPSKRVEVFIDDGSFETPDGCAIVDFELTN